MKIQISTPMDFPNNVRFDNHSLVNRIWCQSEVIDRHEITKDVPGQVHRPHSMVLRELQREEISKPLFALLFSGEHHSEWDSDGSERSLLPTPASYLKLILVCRGHWFTDMGVEVLDAV